MLTWRANLFSWPRRSFTSSRGCCSRLTRQPRPRSRKIRARSSSTGWSSTSNSRTPPRCFSRSVWSRTPRGREIVERAKKRKPFEIPREEVTVAEMLEHAKRVLGASQHPVRLDDLFAGFISRPALIALLLALLEMVRLHAILLRQKDLFAPIMIHKNQRFQEIMSGVKAEDLEASLEEVEKTRAVSHQSSASETSGSTDS